MLSRLHLVRHGEVANPDGVVYADLPGFPLSPVGTAQAVEAADRLATTGARVVVSSPLDRARQTAQPIAGALGVDLVLDDRLTEWGLARRWAGVAWEHLPFRFPGEREAYETHPHDLSFSDESLQEVAHRMEEVVGEIGTRLPGGEAVLVSHQDPLQSLRCSLLGVPLDRAVADKPPHASVITLQRVPTGWSRVSRWVPRRSSDPFPPLNTHA